MGRCAERNPAVLVLHPLRLLIWCISLLIITVKTEEATLFVMKIFKNVQTIREITKNPG
jgi:hypothetical protein